MLADYITVETIKGRSYKYDKADEELVSQYNWRTPKDGYVKEYSEKVVDGNRIRKVVYMHRVIMNAQKGEIVDHINGDTTDNRRSNLRIVSKSINALNSPKHKGVYFNAKTKRWNARLTQNKKTKSLGGYATEAEAIAVYKKTKKELLNELPILNTVG